MKIPVFLRTPPLEKTMIIIHPILLIIQGISEVIKNLVVFLNYSPSTLGN
jgi:TRAP-type mannitol/chloroaromatic compound transport system permease small subunit